MLRSLAMICLICLTMGISIRHVAAEPVPGLKAPEPGELAEVPGKELTPEQKKQRDAWISISWLMLTGIAIIGLLLLMMVFYIGYIFRRQSRKRSPSARLSQPWWYLENDGADPNPKTTPSPQPILPDDESTDQPS